MNISYIHRPALLDELQIRPANSLEFVMLVTGALETPDSQAAVGLLREAVRVLKQGGILFVQGLPKVLPEFGVFLEHHLTFKYWLAIASTPLETTGLPSEHAAVLLFTKGSGRFNIKQVRLPHQYCRACGRTLKDWGGKAHLMHPEGYVVSDVIKDLPPADNYRQLSRPLFDLLLNMLDFSPQRKNRNRPGNWPPPEINGIVGPLEGLAWRDPVIAETDAQEGLPGVPTPRQQQKNTSSQSIAAPKIDQDRRFNIIHQGDVLEILAQYPDESVDLVFADPPYNLDKAYTLYNDEQADHHYVEWCNTWLAEYVRLLKPTGSLFVLNLPRWSLYHAAFLNQRLSFQNWIVWDALSEPRGKVMPAHYALLFYTKHPTHFTWNYAAISPIDARHYCLRASCVRQRKQRGDDEKTPLTDMWWDVHRIKHRRDRDYHPCQLPEPLMERIIRLATNPGDVVLDAFGGTGTSPLTALKLGRQYVAIDVDPEYANLMREKIEQVKGAGQVQRRPVKYASRTVTKKALQLELRHITAELGRLPTPEEVQAHSQYDVELFLETFSSWGKALKAAKVKLNARGGDGPPNFSGGTCEIIR